MKLRSFSGICREIGGTDKTDEPRKIKHICDFSRCRLNVRVKALASNLCSEATNMLYLSFWVLLAGRSENPLEGFRVCLKNHSSNLHASIYGIFCLHSVDVARYAALIQAKSPANCNAHLAESLFQTRSSVYVDDIFHEL